MCPKKGIGIVEMGLGPSILLDREGSGFLGYVQLLGCPRKLVNG